MAGRITHDFTQYADNPRSSRNVHAPVPPANVCITYRYADSLSTTLHKIVLPHDLPDLDDRLDTLLNHFLGTPTPDHRGMLVRTGGAASFVSVTHEYIEV